MLQGRYMSDPPDLVGVVLDAHGFADLLERLSFAAARRGRQRERARPPCARARDATARSSAGSPCCCRGSGPPRPAVGRERDALAAIGEGLRRRQVALTEARAARAAALHATRSGRRRAEQTLARLEAEGAREAQQTAGPGGPWAIPWAVVQCESGGQNLPPNNASASGYYQMLDATWTGLGGSTPQAYQAPKAEQDRLAAQLWAGGAGARNWVCAALVGIT